MRFCCVCKTDLNNFRKPYKIKRSLYCSHHAMLKLGFKWVDDSLKRTGWYQNKLTGEKINNSKDILTNYLDDHKNNTELKVI